MNTKRNFLLFLESQKYWDIATVIGNMLHTFMAAAGEVKEVPGIFMNITHSMSWKCEAYIWAQDHNF